MQLNQFAIQIRLIDFDAYEFENRNQTTEGEKKNLSYCLIACVRSLIRS